MAPAASTADKGLLRGCKRTFSASMDAPSSLTSMDDSLQFQLPLPQVAKVVQAPDKGLGDNSSSSKPQVAGEGEKPYFLDIFCGTAGVAAFLKRHGVEALGIDHILQKNRMKGPAVKMDLTSSSNQELVIEELRGGRVAGVMLAPPCGTSSKARNIPLRNKQGKRVRGPPPLRSHAYPEGLPGLSGISRTRVRQANKLYDFCRRVMDVCEEQGVLCIVENPESSLFWETRYLNPKPVTFQWHIVHACMYGSKRLKKTALLANFSAPNLRLTCDGNHQHLPWSHTTTVDPDTKRQVHQFDTASEAEYPKPFCDALAAAFINELRHRGVTWEPNASFADAAAYLANDKQPRGSSSPVVIPEYKHTVQLTVPVDCALPDEIGPSAPAPFAGVPVGAKLISFQHKHEVGNKDATKTAVYGIFHTPEEFLQQAYQLRHPFNIPVASDVDNLEALAKTLQLGKLEVMKHRLGQIKKYRDLAASLEAEERCLQSSLNPDVGRIMASKRLLLFKQMMEDAGIVDDNLFSELCHGFRLTGQLEASGLFKPRFKPAEMSVDELRKTSRWAKHAIVGSCQRVAENPEVAEAVWSETCSQVESGWIKGPFSAAELDNKYPDGWVPSKRFGVVQGAKVRPVDDFSEFAVNAACGTGEQILLQGLDDVAAAAKYMLSGPSSSGEIWLPSIEGTYKHCGQLHPSWKQEELGDLYGRAMDLKSAYKQLARAPEDDWCSILAVWSPVAQQVQYYESVALPFGAVSAVNAFNRVAKCLRLILCRIFLVVNTSFFDDYCQLEFAPLRESSWKTAEMVLKLLGWQIALADEKRKPFEKEFQMLGAVIDLRKSRDGLVLISNKPKRLEELQASVQELQVGKFMTEAQMQSLRGRLLYAAGHTFGRCTQIAVQALGSFTRSCHGVSLSAEMLRSIQFAVDTLVSAPARVVKAWKDESPVLIFTDGACEDSGSTVTHGAVLCDLTTQSFEFFGDTVPQQYVSEWTRFGKKQVIYQAELFPIWIAKRTWREVIKGRQVLWFCDNEAARSAMIRAYSPVIDSMELVRHAAWEDVNSQTTNWYARVPSKSNLSDSASRLDFEMYYKMGFAKVQPIYAHDV